jgi:hypothetical protein
LKAAAGPNRVNRALIHKIDYYDDNSWGRITHFDDPVDKLVPNIDLIVARPEKARI